MKRISVVVMGMLVLAALLSWATPAAQAVSYNRVTYANATCTIDSRLWPHPQDIVHLSWDYDSAATSYKIYRIGVNPPGGAFFMPGTQTTVNLHGEGSGTHQYRVCSRNSYGQEYGCVDSNVVRVSRDCRVVRPGEPVKPIISPK